MIRIVSTNLTVVRWWKAGNKNAVACIVFLIIVVTERRLEQLRGKSKGSKETSPLKVLPFARAIFGNPVEARLIYQVVIPTLGVKLLAVIDGDVAKQTV